MTRQTKLIILVGYLLILSVVMVAYKSNRSKKIKQLRAQISQVQAEKEKVRKGEAELARLSKLFPASTDLADLVELLYRYAKTAGLSHHQVAADGDKKKSSARPGPAKESGMVVTHSIRVSVSGNFRQVAEYVRQVQNMERFSRISEFKLSTDHEQVKGALTIEVFSLPVKS